MLVTIDRSNHVSAKELVLLNCLLSATKKICRSAKSRHSDGNETNETLR